MTERLGEYFCDLQMVRKNYPQWHYPFSAAELVKFFRAYFGPVKLAFENINTENREKLSKQLENIYASASEENDDGITILNGEYLEIISTRL